MDGKEAIAQLIKAPALVADGTENAPQKITLAAGVAHAAAFCFSAIGVSASTFGSVTWVGRYIRIQCDQDFTIAFGLSGMGAPAIGTEWPLKADTIYEFWVELTLTPYFRAISASNATLFYYLG